MPNKALPDFTEAVTFSSDDVIYTHLDGEVFSKKITGTTLMDYVASSLNYPVDSVNGQTDTVVLDTDDIAEGSTNLYDQTVTLTEGNNITITGTYPDFTVAADIAATYDTRANILALTPPNGSSAYATDTKQLYYYDSGWQEAGTLFNPRTSSLDAGVVQNSNLSGYGDDYITDKVIANSTIGGNVENTEGGVRVIFSNSLGRNIAQFYLDGGWRTALTGVNIATDAEESPVDIEFTDFSPWVLSLITGNSDVRDYNDTPMVQNMKNDAGVLQSSLIVFGGTF